MNNPDGLIKSRTSKGAIAFLILALLSLSPLDLFLLIPTAILGIFAGLKIKRGEGRIKGKLLVIIGWILLSLVILKWICLLAGAASVPYFKKAVLQKEGQTSQMAEERQGIDHVEPTTPSTRTKPELDKSFEEIKAEKKFILREENFRMAGFCLLGGIIYLLPPVIAFFRRHPYRWPITAIGLAAGWTGFGYLGALVWAVWPINIRSHAGSEGF
jgi:hypothetical protein